MEDSKPVTATLSFELLPGCRQRWFDEWKELRDQALTEPTCRQFRLLCDRHDDAHCVVLSEWDRASNFDAFIREAGMIWLERCLEGTSEPLSISIFEAIPVQSDIATHEQVRQPVSVVK